MSVNYESVLVLNPEISPSEQKAFFQKIKEVVKQFKGDLHHVDSWGVRRLANKNKHRQKTGLYFHLSFKADKGSVAELVRSLRMDEKTIYYHFEKLNQSLEDNLSDFHDLLEESAQKEKERQARIQKRKSFFSKRA